MLLSNCVVWIVKSQSLLKNKEQEASGLRSSLGRKTPLNKIPLLGLLLF